MNKEKYTSRVTETTVSIVQTQVESVKKKDISRTGLRIYKDGAIGVSGAIGRFNEQELEQRALDALGLEIPYAYTLSSDRKQALDLSSQILTEQQLLEETEEILADLRKNQPGFSFSHKAKLLDYKVGLENDKGLDLAFSDSHISIELVFKEKASSNIMDGFVGYDGRSYDRNEFLRLVHDICNAYNNRIDLPAGNLPVLFADNEGLIFRKLATELHGQRFATGSSLLSGKTGEALFNPAFTLYQTRNSEETFGPFFDAEGTVNEGFEYALIKEGRLAAPYTDKKVSSLYNLPLTGSAASDYDGVPRLGLSGLRVQESTKTTRELLGGGPGIYVLVASGGDFTTSGDFATPVQLAMLYDGEKFIGRLPELKISSNLFDMFGKGFVGVGKDRFFPLSPTRNIVMDMKVEKA